MGRWKVMAFRLALQLAPAVPRSLGLSIAALAGRLAAALVREPRRAVEANLRHVLGPRAGAAEVRSLAVRVFENSARSYFDFFRLPAMHLAQVERLVRVEGEPHFWEAYRRGRGVVLVTAHLGSFDAAAQVLAARRIEVLILVEPIAPPPLLDLVVGIRRSHGIVIEPVGTAGLRRALEFLRAGQVVAVASDRAIQGRGARIDLFDEPILVPTGALDLALRCGAEVVPAFSIRQSGGRFTIFVEPALPLIRSGDRRRDIAANLPVLRDCLQKYIGAYPDQWVVFEPIWPAGRSGQHYRTVAGAA